MSTGTTFHPSRAFRKKYRSLFSKDPLAANLFLLIAELADDHGQVRSSPEELAILMDRRFKDPTERQL